MKASTDFTAAKKTENNGAPIEESGYGKNRREQKKEKSANKSRTWNGWLEAMNALEEKHPRLAFWGRTAGFYILMMVLFLYFMLANLSTAPKFVYTQF